MLARTRRTGPLLKASAAIAGIVALELLTGPFLVPEAPQQAPTVESLAEAPIVPPRETLDVLAFVEVTARPLFSPTRRPYEPSSEDLAVTKTEMYDLVGVIIEPNVRVALLKPKSSGKVLRVVEGQNVGGWAVRAIRPTHITLGRGNGDDKVIAISEKRQKFRGTRARPQEKVQAEPEDGAQEAAGDEASAETVSEE